MTSIRRSGRRAGDSGTRDAILAAARRSFASAGYTATTIRGVAGAAGVDPALVHHFFGSKDKLFTAATELPVDPAELVAGVLGGEADGLGERLVRTFLAVWDGTPGQGPMLALLRGAVTHEQAAALLRGFLVDVLLGPVARAAGGGAPELRASLVAAQMVGLAMTRYVLHLEPLASAAPDVLAPVVGRSVQHYLTGPLD